MPTAPAYTDEFRRQAVDLIATEKLTVAEAARRLGVDPTTLRKWVKKYRPTPAAPAATPSAEPELRRLREENRQLKMERDILKKAAIYLAQPPT
ncbi:MAG: transposase [Acidimicrobiales bacterium]|nr:transposase [Acidimicrobiales bacterium]